MPWLTVIGTGSWAFGKDTGKAKVNARGEAVVDSHGHPYKEVVLVSYAAGTHEVDEETAARARAARNSTLVVTEAEPVIVKRDPAGPLTWEDLRLPSDGGTYIYVEPEASTGPEDADSVPLEWPCPACPRAFPSRGARDRHEEFEHAEVSSSA